MENLCHYLLHIRLRHFLVNAYNCKANKSFNAIVVFDRYPHFIRGTTTGND